MAPQDDVALIAEQEKLLVFDAFNTETAWELGSRLREIARQRGLGVAIDITLHSMPVFYTVLDGATADNARWVRRKRNVTLHFLQSSYAVGRKLAQQNATLLEKFALPDEDYAPHGGCFPIKVAGAGCIGAVTVSGLPQRDDHNLVVEVLAEMLGKASTVPRLA
jgi:uncharacterized protein (UPF0303 family)